MQGRPCIEYHKRVQLPQLLPATQYRLVSAFATQYRLVSAFLVLLELLCATSRRMDGQCQLDTAAAL